MYYDKEVTSVEIYLMGKLTDDNCNDATSSYSIVRINDDYVYTYATKKDYIGFQYSGVGSLVAILRNLDASKLNVSRNVRFRLFTNHQLIPEALSRLLYIWKRKNFMRVDNTKEIALASTWREIADLMRKPVFRNVYSRPVHYMAHNKKDLLAGLCFLNSLSNKSDRGVSAKAHHFRRGKEEYSGVTRAAHDAFFGNDETFMAVIGNDLEEELLTNYFGFKHERY